ncbi:quinol dehydrogenase ferredoxin subunit NapH [Campylobacter ureolyticus]|uniref:quinol dehydrogenase ferredoxin subunit NapH n=1 Tax=Campylobacter ureolyticus TaxID=827 RepID=UPI0022B3600C|nr:quinol dehydrogenase ferredoxin subunit NapH [Campylobacter ureolyticus]MCZ6169249.1 quinol dehydrogenase ferredoxin subunit NapH [Campylobacter ureolyticus]
MKINNLRRVIQFLVLALFMLGNLEILNILKGNLSSSILLGKISLSDPFAVLQIYLATFNISFVAISGALIIGLFYSLIAPRLFCSWICPVNMITDFAYFVRTKLKIRGGYLNLNANFRYYFLALSLIASFTLGVPAFENISFIGVVQRGLIYLNSTFLIVAFLLFVFDTFVAKRGVCSKICPLGAFYALLSKISIIRVKHSFKNCTKCMDCIKVCPEDGILKDISKKDFFISSSCISCGRCVDVCTHDALNFGIIKKDKK